MKDMLLAVLKWLFAIGPVLFGVAFMAPVLAEIMTASGLTRPFGLSPVIIGLAAGLTWGTYALVRGRWI